MKKVIFTSLALSALLFSIQSCSQNCHTCVLNNNSTEYCPGTYTQAQVDAFHASCTNNGGNWN